MHGGCGPCRLVVSAVTLLQFLSAIMRRQYGEALKYCRLILQYEPHNASARAFYPLLQHKLAAHRPRSAREPPDGNRYTNY